MPFNDGARRRSPLHSVPRQAKVPGQLWVVSGVTVGDGGGHWAKGMTPAVSSREVRSKTSSNKSPFLRTFVCGRINWDREIDRFRNGNELLTIY